MNFNVLLKINFLVNVVLSTHDGSILEETSDCGKFDIEEKLKITNRYIFLSRYHSVIIKTIKEIQDKLIIIYNSFKIIFNNASISSFKSEEYKLYEYTIDIYKNFNTIVLNKSSQDISIDINSNEDFFGILNKMNSVITLELLIIINNNIDKLFEYIILCINYNDFNEDENIDLFFTSINKILKNGIDRYLPNNSNENVDDVNIEKLFNNILNDITKHDDISEDEFNYIFNLVKQRDDISKDNFSKLYELVDPILMLLNKMSKIPNIKELDKLILDINISKLDNKSRHKNGYYYEKQSK